MSAISHPNAELTKEPSTLCRLYLLPLSDITLSTQLRKRTTDDTLVQLSYTPLGDVLHVPPHEPRSDWANDFGTPWWKDRSLWIAKLSQKQRPLRVVNTLTHQEDLVEVNHTFLREKRKRERERCMLKGKRKRDHCEQRQRKAYQYPNS